MRVRKDLSTLQLLAEVRRSWHYFHFQPNRCYSICLLKWQVGSHAYEPLNPFTLMQRVSLDRHKGGLWEVNRAMSYLLLGLSGIINYNFAGGTSACHRGSCRCVWSDSSVINWWWWTWWCCHFFFRELLFRTEFCQILVEKCAMCG